MQVTTSWQCTQRSQTLPGLVAATRSALHNLPRTTFLCRSHICNASQPQQAFCQCISVQSCSSKHLATNAVYRCMCLWNTSQDQELQ